MTVATETYFAELAWTGAQSSFSPGIRVRQAEHLIVTHVASGVSTELTAGIHYFTTLAGDNLVTVYPMPGFPVAAGTIQFERYTPATQGTAFANLESYDAAVHEALHDAAAMRDAEIRGKIAASVRLDPGDVGDVSAVLPPAEAGKLLKWNETADALENADIAASVAVGTVTTLSPGAPATVTNVGTSENAIFNFGIPQGAEGAPGAGSGDVLGPATSADEAVPRFNGTNNKTLQSSPVKISDAGVVTGIDNVTGEDANLVTGTAGSENRLAMWDANGDLVDASIAVTVALGLLAAVTPAADRLPYFTGPAAAALATLTAQARTFLAAANQADQRTALGLGALATLAAVADAQFSGQLSIGKGGTGQATAGAAFDALAPTTTRGDIIIRGTSANQRLAKGTAGHVLTMGANEPAWAAAPGQGIVTLVAPTSLPAASALNLTGIAQTYSELILVVSGLSTNGTSTLRVQGSHDGSNWDNTASNYRGLYLVDGASIADLTGGGFLEWTPGSAASTADFILRIGGYTTPRPWFDYILEAGSLLAGGRGYYIGTAPLLGVRVTVTGGNAFDAGTYALYGRP